MKIVIKESRLLYEAYNRKGLMRCKWFSERHEVVFHARSFQLLLSVTHTYTHTKDAVHHPLYQYRGGAGCTPNSVRNLC